MLVFEKGQTALVQVPPKEQCRDRKRKAFKLFTVTTMLHLDPTSGQL